MNRNLLTAVATLSLAGLSVCFSATAQEREPMIVHIPFAFEAGKAQLSAGDYRIEQSRNLVFLRNRESKKTVMIPVHTVERKNRIDESYVTFHKIGNSYFLAETWSAGSANGGGVAPSNHEREAANPAASSTVAEVKVPVR